LIGSPVAAGPRAKRFKDAVSRLRQWCAARIRAVFASPGLYQFHCHIVKHEDDEMMIPLCAKESAADTACLATPGASALADLERRRGCTIEHTSRPYNRVWRQIVGAVAVMLPIMAVAATRYGHNSPLDGRASVEFFRRRAGVVAPRLGRPVPSA
jgi:hypothetical protein